MGDKKEAKRVPKLRFKGFTDDWEQRKLKYYMRVSTEKNKNHIYDKKDVLSVSGEYGVVNQIKFQGRSFAGKDVSNYKVLMKNNIVYTKSPLKNNPYGIIKVNHNKTGIVSTLYAVYIPTLKVYPDFIELYFADNLRLNRYLKPIVNIGAKHDMKIKNNEVINHFVTFPSKNEQKNISQLFKQIEKVISLQQRKIDKLKFIKKAMEEYIYPNQNNFRKIKLSDSIWKLKKIKNIFNERNERTDEGQLLSVSINNGIYPFNEKERKNNSSKDKSNYKRVEKGDIAYNSMRMWQGACGVSNYVGIVSPAYTVITPQKNQNAIFYYYYFKNNRMLYTFQRNSQGLTSDTWNLKFRLLKNISIFIPNEKEQMLISNRLKKIDTLIFIETKMLRILEQVKQFLLQNMFI